MIWLLFEFYFIITHHLSVYLSLKQINNKSKRYTKDWKLEIFQSFQSLEHLHRESCAPDYTKMATHLVVHHCSKCSKSDSSLLNTHESCNFCKSFILFTYPLCSLALSLLQPSLFIILSRSQFSLKIKLNKYHHLHHLLTLIWNLFILLMIGKIKFIHFTIN